MTDDELYKIGMSEVRDLDAIDPTFADDLVASIEHTWRVARWLQSIGMCVAVNPVRVRPDPESRSEYADSGDITVVQRMEVKQRQIAFTCQMDYPYKTIIVDVEHAWDKAFPKPYGYVITNKDVTACAIVLGSTSKNWIRTEKQDRFRGRVRRFVECPVEHAIFMKIS